MELRGMLPTLPYVPYPGLIRRAGLRGVGQYVDVGSFDLGSIDLGDIINTGVNAGETWVTNQINDAFNSKVQATGGSTDIVPMQNLVGAAIGQLSTSYNALKQSRQLTPAIITTYQTALRALLTNFCAYAKTLGTSRAQAGCDTLMGYFWPWLDAMERDRQALGGTGYTGQTIITDPTTGKTYTVGGGTGLTASKASEYLPWIIGGVFLLMSWKSIRR